MKKDQFAALGTIEVAEKIYTKEDASHIIFFLVDPRIRMDVVPLSGEEGVEVRFSTANPSIVRAEEPIAFHWCSDLPNTMTPIGIYRPDCTQEEREKWTKPCSINPDDIRKYRADGYAEFIKGKKFRLLCI